jgi:hypothetical protein
VEATITAKDRKDVVDDSYCKVVKLNLVFFTAINQYTVATCLLLEHFFLFVIRLDLFLQVSTLRFMVAVISVPIESS